MLAPGASPSHVIRYGSRTIDFSRYVGISDNFMRTMATTTDRALYWLEWGVEGGIVRRATELAGGWTEDDARDVFHLGMRSFWSPTFHAPSRSFFFVSDEHNNETFNVYRFSADMQDVSQVTQVGYAMGYTFSAQSSKLVFLGRSDKFGETSSLYESGFESPRGLTALHTDDESFRI